jgi:NifU-like protein involved in Fe-S cluster formation
MTNEKLCCDLEHAKLLAETGLMKDVKADHIGCRYLQPAANAAAKLLHLLRKEKLI